MVTSIKKRPQAGSATGRVWEIADALLREKGGALPTGREVANAYLSENRNYNEGTAFTQYSHWKKAHLAHFERGPHPSVLEDGAVRVTVGIDGRLVIPASVRDRLGWRPGDELLLKRDGRGVRIDTRADVIADAQAMITKFDTGGAPILDEIEADRGSSERLEG